MSLLPWVLKIISFSLLASSESTRKHWLSFKKKNSPLLLYHNFLKFHKNIIIFFGGSSFGNSHELIIKCLILLPTVRAIGAFSSSFPSFLPPPSFFPSFFRSRCHHTRSNCSKYQEDQVIDRAVPLTPWPWADQFPHLTKKGLTLAYVEGSFRF